MASVSHFSDNNNPVLLFSSLPKRSDLCAVMAFISRPPERSHYAKTAYQWLVLKCRMLIFGEDQILSSPVLRSESHLYVVASKTFLAAGKLKILLEKHGIKESGCRAVEVTDTLLQACLRYSLLARMAPQWNQLGPSYLVQGRDFLMDTAPFAVVKLDVLVQGDQMCLGICPLRMRLPHLQLSDLEVDPQSALLFLTQQLPVLAGSSIGHDWLCTLPGLRRGRVLSITHKIPPTCPFLTYRELRRHWKNMYGYRLPEDNPNTTCSPAGPYITVTFRKWNDRHDVGYTYPALCVRAYNPILLHNIDEASTVRDFAQDLSLRLKQLCGISFQLSLKLGRPLSSLTSALQSDEHQFHNLPANVSAVSVTSLPSGWKPTSQQSQVFSQTSELHTQSWSEPCTPSTSQNVTPATLAQNARQQHVSHTATMQNSTNFKSPLSRTAEKNDTKIVNENLVLTKQQAGVVNDKEESKNSSQLNFMRNSHERKMMFEQQPVVAQGGVVSLETPKKGDTMSDLRSATTATDSATMPGQSAAASSMHRSKWDPKPLLQHPPVQDTSITSSVVARPLYVPVFGKKSRSGEHNKTAKELSKETSTSSMSRVFKPFKTPQALTSASSYVSKEYPPNKDSNSTRQCTPPQQQASVSKTLYHTETFSMSINPHSFHTPANQDLQKSQVKKSLGVKSKTPQPIDGATPAKKLRPAKPDLSDVDVERLAKEGKLEQMSAPQLVKWLKDHNIQCKARDKKLILVTKVVDYFQV